MTEYTGKDFNSKFNNEKFILFVTKKNYKNLYSGLNTNKNGLEFNNLSVSGNSDNCYGFFNVQIPVNAQVYETDGIFTADKLYLYDFEPIYNLNHVHKNLIDSKFYEYLMLVKEDGLQIKKIDLESLEKYQSYILQNSALRQNIKSIKYMTQQFNTCYHLIERNPLTLKYLEEINFNQFEWFKLCSCALKKEGRLLKILNNPNIVLCKIAIEQNEYARKYIPARYENIL